MAMVVVIPTMGRVNKQDTLNSLRGMSVCDVMLACPVSEHAEHVRQGRLALAVPDDVKGIAATRQWIMWWAVGKFDTVCMMDDDLTFAVRRVDNPTLFRDASVDDINAMLWDLNRQMQKHVHGSISMREGANRDINKYRRCSRVARVIAYDVEKFFQLGCDFRHSTVMDDFEVTLQLLTKGYPNIILNNYVQNQRGSGTEGGASLYRTLDVHAAAARTLAARWPAFVKTVEKTTKTAWGGATRTDVVVQWKKAYESHR